MQGERIGDAAARSWNRLVGIWANFRQAESRLPKTDRTATTLTRDRWLKPLLEELGFVGIPRVQTLTIDEKDYPISHEWGGSVPVHQLGWRLLVDKRSPGITGAAKTSPHSLLQEFLNRSDQHLWGIVTNGQVLRLLRDNATLTRQAYCDFDLRAIFDGNAYSDFQTLWRTCHRTRFEGNPPANCYLEKWNLEAITAGTRALDQLREGVENALLQLGNGFLSHRANTQLRESIRNGELTADDYLRQLLRLVYRMLFLLVAESREMLLDPNAGQAAKDRYYQYYSVTRLRRLAERRRGTAHSDLWQSLQVTMNSLDSQSAGISALGLVPLGSFLWSPNTISDIQKGQIDNRYLLAAVHHLCFTRDAQAKVPRPVDYRNLGSEELGSVYESLLELHADLNGDARTFKLDTAAGSERKVTGSYYTPTPLIDRLLDETLEPLLDQAETQHDPEKALLGLRVLDPAVGSGHFLIAAAHRITRRLATFRTNGDEPTPEQTRAALRQVIGQCVYGIDINPMAVELCKVSLWLEANQNGQPLNFLDHHIVCGNSFLGTTLQLLDEGIPQEVFKKRPVDDTKRLAVLRKRNLAERKQRNQGILALGWSAAHHIAALADDLAVINTGEDTTTADVDVKADLYNELLQSDNYTQTKLAADAWCAAFVIPKTNNHPAITDTTIRSIGLGNPIPPDVQDAVTGIAEEYQFFHPHIEFPDVYEQSGGFDLVIGNPPWGRIKQQEKKWFATRDQEIAEAPNQAARRKLINTLKVNNPGLYSEFQAALQKSDGTSTLLRKAGCYPLTGRGDINAYAVFAEFMRNATSPTGHTGMVVPTGIATDDTTKHFFADLTSSRSIVSLYDFENRKKLFPAVDSRQRFCLLSLSGEEHPVTKADFLFFARQIADLNDPDRNFTLTSADFALFSPNTRNSPSFRSPRDMQIARKMYQQSGVLWQQAREGEAEQNPWKVSFKRLFDMSNDSGLFRTRSQLQNDGWTLQGNVFARGEDRYLPLYESKLFHQYDHRFATFEGVSHKDIVDGEPRYVTLEERIDPLTAVIPRYWVAEEEVIERLAKMQDNGSVVRPSVRPTDRPNRHPRLLGPQLAFRMITRATDHRTVFLAVIPNGALGHSGALMMFGSSFSGRSQEQQMPAHSSLQPSGGQQ